MKTNEFLFALRDAVDQPLLFGDLAGHVVQRGYHLTEIKAAKFDTVDCGGQLNHWRETIVQLWLPEDADPSYMTVGKFLKIFDKVAGILPLDREAEIRVEYGDEKFFPSLYHVRAVTHERDATHVRLEAPAMTCKARDRRLGDFVLGSCCNTAAPTCCAL